MEFLTLGIFCTLLIVCIITGKSILYALSAGLILFSLYGKQQGYTWKEIGRMALQGVGKVKNILVTFVLIGILTALWRQAGTISAIICYTVHLIRPSTFLLMTFLLNCLVSVLTGTALGTAATIGVVCATMGTALGISSWMIGGAILSGVYFGDRCSPVSTSALLVAELTETSVYENIKNMIKSAVFPFVFTCIVYFTVSMQLHGKAEIPDLAYIFKSEFWISWITLLPAVVILVLSVMKAGVKAAMSASIVTAIPICIAVQHMPVQKLPGLLLMGYHSADLTIAGMLNGGGIASMLKVGAIVCISSSYSGIFQKTGILDGLQKMVYTLAEKTQPYFAVLVTAILTSVIACNQTLAIMLTDQLCSKTESDNLRFANFLEDSAVIVAPLVPWSIACAVPLTAAGAPGYSILFALFLYLLPVWDLLMFRKRKI
ncbi:Na+/H+ antiporter NhaC family protein [Blautia sp. MSJ-19]|uniref:Na+/H+ antiporter NhaC family protein n=1 Tax=Blautia sp. MSJ-19 TaxID=2841517 RepID=UPI001C0EA2E8|nr:Na+/H+ antiporter NhaC family protein [Blautia sp. MSJ-19]MBU5480872.1 sodium:proton antiporter [Blautia sp. MSJ-19]